MYVPSALYVVVPLKVNWMSAETPAQTLLRSSDADKHDSVTVQVPTMSPPHGDAALQAGLPPSVPPA